MDTPNDIYRLIYFVVMAIEGAARKLGTFAVNEMCAGMSKQTLILVETINHV